MLLNGETSTHETVRHVLLKASFVNDPVPVTYITLEDINGHKKD